MIIIMTIRQTEIQLEGHYLEGGHLLLAEAHLRAGLLPVELPFPQRAFGSYYYYYYHYYYYYYDY